MVKVPDDRVLLLAPTRRDARTTSSLLRDTGATVHACSDFDEVLREIEAGVAVVIVPEEELLAPDMARLARVVREQEPWSDLPILVMTYVGADSAVSTEAVRALGNVTLLERPLRIATLVTAVRTALRARERQYQIRSYLLERARTEESLRLADQRKDEFLATLGHELRNPLSPLVSGMQLLRLDGIQSPALLRIIAVMERQVQHLVRLVDDLLEVSRITRGLVEVRQDVVDLSAVVRAAIETSRPAIELANHQLSMELPAAPVPVRGDAVRLTQVFANLLTNAAKYTNAGGHISVVLTRDGDRASVSVRDDGIGISPSHLASVFDMFMQVDRTNRRSQGGLGIGLTLVRSLVALHGGTVRARSEGLDKGSEFTVELPALERSIETSAQPSRLAPFPPCRILLVDDNRDAADTLGALLEALGASVALAHGGRSAIEVLAHFEPDAILLDIGMPEMDGYELARVVRTMPNGQHALMIALTGWGQDHDQRLSQAAGFDHHMVKPPDIDRLRDFLTQTPAPDVAPMRERG
jgi:signal transduction histidine kinase/ActR/RegA family two-component response regulator